MAGASVAVLDVAPGPAAALALCAALHAARADLPVLALLCCDRCADTALVRAMFAAGARGLLDLQTPSRKVHDALLDAAAGRIVLRAHFRPAAEGAPPAAVLAGLERPVAGLPANVAREAHLLRLLVSGRSNEEIARALCRRPDTVHHRIGGLIRSLGVRNRVELAAWSSLHGLYAPSAGGAPATARPGPAT